MDENYVKAVREIKVAILQSQSRAAKSTNAEMLSLYYAIGGYVSANSREGTWGTGAIEEISTRLREELPGLRGFSAGNIKFMRQFYESWSPFLPASAAIFKSLTAATELEEYHKNERKAPERSTNLDDSDVNSFLAIGFTHHMIILRNTCEFEERLFYIRECAKEKWSKRVLQKKLNEDLYHHQGALINNFEQNLPEDRQSLKAISMFRDEYLLDFINTEELDLTKAEDVDERVLEGEIVRNIRNFIQCLGSGFCFVGNQHRIDVDGEEFYADLLFYQRDLKSLVVIELKSGKFKPAYLGQLNFYLSALDEKERKDGENPSIGILLCKEANKSVVELAIRDFTKPMGVATYRTAEELPSKYKVLAPIFEEAPRLM